MRGSGGGSEKISGRRLRRDADPALRLLLCSRSNQDRLTTGFEALGFDVRIASPDLEGIGTSFNFPADLVVVDCSDDEDQQVQWCRNFRARVATSTVPLIALTKPEQDDLRVALLAAGADDCLIGPITAGESEGRIKSVLRRAALPAHPTGELRYADVILDPLQLKVWRRGIRIPITALRFKLLQFLMTNSGTVFSCEDLRRKVWDDAPVEDFTIIQCVSRLRRALNSVGGVDLIRSTRNGGYSIDDCATSRSLKAADNEIVTQ